jgi:hypothetical protein
MNFLSGLASSRSPPSILLSVLSSHPLIHSQRHGLTGQVVSLGASQGGSSHHSRYKGLNLYKIYMISAGLGNTCLRGSQLVVIMPLRGDIWQCWRHFCLSLEAATSLWWAEVRDVAEHGSA